MSDPIDPASDPALVPFATPTPRVRRSWLVDHNPFYLLSAACMLAGCLAITNSLSWTSIPKSRLLALIGTLNVYEAALIGIGIFLFKRGLLRDARWLLGLEAFFLADATFLNAEVVTADLKWGLALNLALFLLAIAKVGLVLRVMGRGLPRAATVFVVGELAVLFAVPCVMRWMDHGSVSPRDFYVAWWAAGLLPALYALAARIERGLATSAGEPMRRVSGIAILFVALPWVSLIAHVGILHYVYEVTYFGAFAAPVLLGLTVVMTGVSPSALAKHAELVLLRLLMPLAAVLVSMNNPESLIFHIGKKSFSPLNFAIAGAYVTYIYTFLLPYAAVLIVAGFAVALAAVFGPTAAQVTSGVGTGFDRVLDFLGRLIPQTAAQWGAAAVAAAFAFLGIGVAVSLRNDSAHNATGKPPGNGN